MKEQEEHFNVEIYFMINPALHPFTSGKVGDFDAFLFPQGDSVVVNVPLDAISEVGAMSGAREVASKALHVRFPDIKIPEPYRHDLTNTDRFWRQQKNVPSVGDDGLVNV